MNKKQKIEEVLREKLRPLSLEVEDVSYQHAGHNPEAAGGETHFNVSIVTESFKDMPLLKRHRMIYGYLQEAGVTYHALAIEAKAS